MKFYLFILLASIFSVNAIELPYYEAKYKFESDAIKITGVRELKHITSTMTTTTTTTKYYCYYYSY